MSTAQDPPAATAASASLRPQERSDEPVYLPSAERTLFGWLHWPAQATRPAQPRLGLVVCKPFGFESLCGQRSLRAIAEGAADVGVPTLRFDYSGCGDSQDLPPDSDQLEVWVRDILAAVEHLRLRTGVERVCLVGVRLGALLATLAATRTDLITGLYLFAPVVSGRRYLKELRAAQIAENSPLPPENLGTPAGEVSASDPGACEFGGFIMTGSTIANLSAIDLAKAGELPRVQNLFIADRSDLPAAAKWSSELTAAGVPAHYERLPGFVEMALVAPHWAEVPTQMIASLQQWLTAQTGEAAAPLPSPAADTHPAAREQPPAAQRASPPIFINPHSSLTLATTAARTAIPIQEWPVAIPSGAQVFGIVTAPAAAEKRRRAVILLNTGVDYHMGVSRTYVTLARNWARSGYHVLRMDLTGIGDSGNAAGQPHDVVYSPQALDDVRAAVDYVRSRYGIPDITLAGVCSGAYHSLRAAAAGLPVQQVLMVNPLTYFWQPGTSLDGLQLAEIVRNPGVYRERMVSAKAWERLFTGKVNVWRIVSIYMRRPLLSLRSRVRDLARALGLRLPMDLGRELQEIAARGIRIVFVFAQGEAGLELLHIEAGAALRKLGPRCRIRLINDGDHTFTQHGARTILERVLSEELFSRPTEPRPAAAHPLRAPSGRTG